MNIYPTAQVSRPYSAGQGSAQEQGVQGLPGVHPQVQWLTGLHSQLRVHYSEGIQTEISNGTGIRLKSAMEQASVAESRRDQVWRSHMSSPRGVIGHCLLLTVTVCE